MQSPTPTRIFFLDDHDPTPHPMEVSEELAAAMAVAARVPRMDERFSISFASLFIGLLVVPDATGQ